jgi:hypothetical protein
LSRAETNRATAGPLWVNASPSTSLPESDPFAVSSVVTVCALAMGASLTALMVIGRGVRRKTADAVGEKNPRR